MSSGRRPVGVGPAVGVDELPGRGDADRPSSLNVNCFGSFTKWNRWAWTAAELLLAVDAERVVPDHPAPAGESPSSRWKISFSSAAYSSPIASQNVPSGLSTRWTAPTQCRDQSR